MNAEPIRLWNIDRAYRCPVVGFCLDQDEREAIYRKSAKGDLPDLGGIGLHEFLVTALAAEGPIATRIETLLDRKYARLIAAYREADFTSWFAAAEALLNAEGFGAYIWISARYAIFEKSDNDALYGAIHMYSHDMRKDLQRKNREAAALEKERDRLEEGLKEAKRRAKELDKELSAARRERTASSAPPGVAARGSPDTAAMESRLRELEKANATLREENRRLAAVERESMDWLARAKADMERFFEAFTKSATAPRGPGCPAASSRECPGPAEGCDLCSRRILVVGGIERLKGFYGEVVHRMNGAFMYHDGKCQNSDSGLPELISRADVVLCPVDVNSHAACLRVKKVCKETGKDFFMLRKSSVSSVYETLTRVAASGSSAGRA